MDDQLVEKRKGQEAREPKRVSFDESRLDTGEW